MTESDIIYEDGPYWVKRAVFNRSEGYEVYKVRGVASYRIAVIGYPGADGLTRCKAEIARRKVADQ